MSQPKVRVFWDLETCPPPTSHTPWEILKDLRLFTSRFGIASSFKAYWDRGNSNNAADPLRAAMPSMGVNLVDCSLVQGHNKDALTRMLVVDVLISAVDEPVPSDTPVKNIIMILSGDESVLYPISLLMFRNYSIFLVVPDENHKVQPFQATQIFYLHRDILTPQVQEQTPTLTHTSVSQRAPAVTGSEPKDLVDYTQMLIQAPPPSSPTKPTVDVANTGWTDGTPDLQDGWTLNSNWAIDVGRYQDSVEEFEGEGARTIEPDVAELRHGGSTSQPPKDIPISLFEPLLQILRESKKRSMGRSKLGEELAKQKSIYKAAGVKGFSEYMAFAVAKDLVIAGGVGNNLYVRLHPKFKNAQ